jgi:NYN domain/OST-HTH/LOTUS domain
MSDPSRVAVYFDFDNVVISYYDNVFGDGTWRRDDARRHAADGGAADPIDLKLSQAAVDLGAIIDYASSFGTVALTRAYADWSLPANAAYRKQLIDRAVDLVQLFTTSGMKNGADIRLSIDAVEDLTQHADITHVVVVAGDSDYIPLAQRCKRMGRFVVGIGVASSTSRALVAACDEFTDYARLPGVISPTLVDKRPATTAPAATTQDPPTAAMPRKTAAKKTAARKATRKATARSGDSAEQAEATALLVRAVRVGLEKSDDEWINSSGVKSQMQRMDSTFKEKALGFSSFRAFVESRSDVVESQMRNNIQKVRLR